MPRRKLTKVDDTGFGPVVSSLQLRDIDNVTTHAGSGNEAAITIALKLPAIYIRTLLLLASPGLTSCPGAVENTVEVCRYDLAVVLNLPIKRWALSPRYTGVSDEYIQSPIEFFDNLINKLLNLPSIGDIDLVCSASTHKIVKSVPRTGRCTAHTALRTHAQSLVHGRWPSCFHDTR